MMIHMLIEVLVDAGVATGAGAGLHVADLARPRMRVVGRRLSLGGRRALGRRLLGRGGDVGLVDVDDDAFNFPLAREDDER